MLAIDDGDVDFTEEEMSDHALASGIGWTLKVKATREAPLRGGVLADAVGAGKTVAALALVAARAELARRGVASRPKEVQHAGATLVVAPRHCLRPVWHQMVEDFTTGLKHVVIEGLGDLLKVDPNPNPNPNPNTNTNTNTNANANTDNNTDTDTDTDTNTNTDTNPSTLTLTLT